MSSPRGSGKIRMRRKATILRDCSHKYTGMGPHSGRQRRAALSSSISCFSSTSLAHLYSIIDRGLSPPSQGYTSKCSTEPTAAGASRYRPWSPSDHWCLSPPYRPPLADLPIILCVAPSLHGVNLYHANAFRGCSQSAAIQPSDTK